MNYRAHKIRQGKSIKRHEYSESRRRLPLDPDPFACGHPNFRGMRHVSNWCGDSTFDPRPGYEQDRSKYE